MYLMVECSRDKLLFQRLKEKNLIPREIDVLREHGGRDLILKGIPHLLNTYDKLYVAVDLDRYSESQLVENIVNRLDGSYISGKHFRRVEIRGYIVRMELVGERKTKSKTLYIISLGLPNNLRLRNMGISRFMVEDYYVEAAFQAGELREEDITGQRFTTSKELLEKELLTESILEQRGEWEYLVEILEKCELNKVAGNIIEKIRFSLEARGMKIYD